MLERQESQENFDKGLDRIAILAEQGKAFSIRLAGPKEDRIIACNDFATIIFDRENRDLVLVPISARGSEKEDICRMILDLGSPDNFVENEISVDADIKKNLRLECVTKDTPLAVIVFGKTKDPEVDAAVLYVVAGVSPKEMHEKMWKEANKVINEFNENEQPPDAICS